MTRLLLTLCAGLLLAGCTSTPWKPEPESPMKRVERFFVMPVVYNFDVPADWEISAQEWDEKMADFSEAFEHRLEVTRRAPISRLRGDVPAGGASIQLFVTEVDLGFFGGIIRKAAICKGTLVIIDSIGVELWSEDVEFRTPRDAGWQWYTYGGRLESAHDDFAVEVISIIQRERR